MYRRLEKLYYFILRFRLGRFVVRKWEQYKYGK